ncbi:MAG: EVE domain-containing protein [Patescibacteria group bacterium]
MAYWLLKTDPDTYAWDDLVKEKRTAWTGVRNFQARNFLRAMQANDVAFIYHSMDERAVVGIARIVSGPYADADDDAWTVVDVQAWKPLAVPVTLVQIKMRKTLAKMLLVTHSRLSVMPLTLGQAKALLTMGKTEMEK